MPRLRHAGPPPKASLPPPPNLSEFAQLMWLDQDIMEDNMPNQLRCQRNSNVDPECVPSAPPPTPRMRESRPAIPLVSEEDEPLDAASAKSHSTAGSGHDNGREGLQEENTRNNRNRGRETRRQSQLMSTGQSVTSSSTSNSGKQVTELGLDSRRRSRSQDDKKIFMRTASDRDIARPREHAQHAQGEEGGVSLKPLTPLPPASASASSPKERGKKPVVGRKRSVSIAKISPDQINQTYKAEIESMTEDPVIRGYAQRSQEELYGPLGISDIENTPMMQRYSEPNRDTEEINRNLYKMTVHDHDYRVGGPPSPVDIYNIDYHSDISEVQGRAEFEHAREAKAFAAYAMFTERQEEIDMLRRLQAHGFLN